MPASAPKAVGACQATLSRPREEFKSSPEAAAGGKGGLKSAQTALAGRGKSALVQHVLGAVRADEGARSTVLVAQSSAALGGVTLFTVRAAAHLKCYY